MDQEELQFDGDGPEESFNENGSEDTFNESETTGMDEELETIKARVREMENEAERIRQIQSEVDEKMNTGGAGAAAAAAPVALSLTDKMKADGRSIYVGNVDYGATAEELEQHFHGCGAVNRVTIQCNKFDGHPKGFAYIEFVDKDSVQLAMALDESLFRGRQLKVMPKRTNKPGISSTNRFPRSMRRAGVAGGARGGAAARMMAAAAAMLSGYRPARRPRGRRFHFAPY